MGSSVVLSLSGCPWQVPGQCPGILVLWDWVKAQKSALLQSDPGDSDSGTVLVEHGRTMISRGGGFRKS